MKNRDNPEKSVLILFPRGEWCSQLVSEFAQRDFSVFVVTLGHAGEFQFEEAEKNISVIGLHAPMDEYWDNLPSEIKSNWLNVLVVIYCADKDFLRTKASGKEEEWQIDLQNAVQQRFSFIDRLLEQFSPGNPKLWFNVAIGARSPDQMVTTHCKTRYGMIGFSKALELNSKFKGMEVQNICLSFFRFFRKHPNADYCTNCTTAQQREAMKKLTDENELVHYLVDESERIWGNSIHR